MHRAYAHARRPSQLNGRIGLALHLAAEIAGRLPQVLFEYLAEIVGVGKAAAPADVGQGQRGAVQQAHRFFQPKAREILDRMQARFVGKGARQVALAYAQRFAGVLQADGPAEIFLQIKSA